MPVIQFACSECGYEMQAADGTSPSALIICDRCGARVTVPPTAAPSNVPAALPAEGPALAGPANDFANLGDDTLPEPPPDDEPGIHVDLPDPLPGELKELGEPVRNCPTASQVPTVLIGGGVVALVIAAVGLFWFLTKLNAPGGRMQSPMTVLSFLLLLIPLGICLIWLGWTVDWQARIVVFRKGFAHFKRERITAFPWDDIDAVWQAVTNHYYNGAYTHTTYNYRIRRNDGEQLSLDNVYPAIKWLGEKIQNEVIGRQLQRSIDTLNQGGTVRFGRLSVSPEGIGCDGSVLPWSDVEKVEVQQGVISVRKQGKWFNWGKVTVPEVPNVFVFLALVDQIIGINTRRR